MTKTKLVLSTAIIAQALAFAATPAMAAPASTTAATMQAACDAGLPGNTTNTIWSAVPYIANTSTTTTETSRVTIENIPGGLLLGQTPYTFTAGSEHRNGYSTNVHGNFTSIATYSGGKLVQQVTDSTVTTYTFGCTVTRNRGGVRNQPAGQQVAPTLTASDPAVTSTRLEEVSAPDYTVTLNAEKVICISPKKNPGTWTNQNGYTGTCNSALYLAVAQGGPVPSNSVPGVTQMTPNAPDHQTALPEDQLYYPPLVDDEAFEETI